MSARVDLEVAPETPPERLQMLIQMAEHSCVVARTLPDGVPPLSIEIAGRHD